MGDAVTSTVGDDEVVALLVGPAEGDGVGLPFPSTYTSAQFQNCSGTPTPSSGMYGHSARFLVYQLSSGNGYLS